MFKITSMRAREILDSRGNPTVEAECTLEDGSFGRAAVPSGASTGSHEAIELRDGGARYHGKGVTQAVNNVNTRIAEALVGNAFSQRELDETLITLDGTATKAHLGANAILGASLAFARASAVSQKVRLATYFRSLCEPKNPMRLPLPLMNIINGGKHAENAADFQECMIVPLGMPSFKEALRAGAEVFHTLKKILSSRGLSTAVGDEGGYAPALASNAAALDVILEAIHDAGYVPGTDIALALDVAATELYRNGVYELAREGKTFSSAELIDFYEELVARYPIVSIEDPLAEDDWTGYTEVTKRLGDRVQIVGDDLFVTNVERLSRGIAEKSANSILIKLNQIGTVSETIDAIALAEGAHYTAIISHRSGETEDTTIADFVVGLGVGQIKTGSLSRSDRVAKYNQLLRIEEYLAEEAIYAGKEALA